MRFIKKATPIWESPHKANNKSVNLTGNNLNKKGGFDGYVLFSRALYD